MKWPGLRWPGVIVAGAFAAITFGLWAYLNQPTVEPEWPSRVQGMAFSPFYSGQDPVQQVLPSVAQIDADLRLLSDKVTAVRTYSALYSLGQVPEIAAKYNLKVAVGTWLDRQRATNEREIQAAVALAERYPNVIRLIIGNEVILRGDLTVAELSQHLERVRATVEQPVSTAEPWHVWIRHPELADHVDFITVHLLPYWEGIAVDAALDYVDSRMRLLQQRFPGKSIVIGEVGWPSDGRTREFAAAQTSLRSDEQWDERASDAPRCCAVPSASNQALFLRRFLARAQQHGYLYYLMEAFDQPWKVRYEGGVGAYWGIYDVDRKPKFEFIEPIVRVPQWQILAAASVALAALLLSMFYMHSATLRMRGRSLLAIVAYAAATMIVWIVYDYSQQYLTTLSVLIGIVLVLGTLGVMAVLLAEAHEWAEAHWATSRGRAFDPPARRSLRPPKVSIHVPAYDEPAGMLIATLDSLARLDYPDFEVIVIDNNTPHASTWQPVRAHCERLGTRFQFHHIDQLAGFKAGALNFALRHTAADAEIVAVLDSDYQVDPDWLGDLTPAFDREQVAIVQAPQDYRDAGSSAFKAMCYAEYRGFFMIGMVTRNERNAIIQHGTMTLVRRTALQAVGGWAEWCITEDAELGLRLFENGHEAQYQARSYGRGLMPETFVDYKKQRFRWAYGAMQILRRHAGALFARDGQQLTRGQRYHFIAGWLPWLADGVNLLFNAAAIAWSIAIIIAPQRVDPPLVMFSILPMSLFTFRLVKLAHLYVSRIGANIRQTLAAAFAGLSLAHTIGLAVLKALVTRDEPFVRTPKGIRPHPLASVLAGARQEGLLLLILIGCAFGMTRQWTVGDITLGIPEEMTGPDVSVWVAVLLMQSVPYAAAVLLSLVSAAPFPARWLGDAPTAHTSKAPAGS